MPRDFCRIFQSAMPNLYLLALLLTGEQDKAEECFVGGLEDCTEGNPVFKQWALSWAKRAIIKRAIGLVPPPTERNGSESGACATEQSREADVLFSAVIELPRFERFVFVMTVLERYSDQECSLLLNCTRRDVADARARAVQRVAESAKDRLVEQIEH
jgi:DNA-directed RNA polymerase specialized sigma24 family protein